VEPDLPPAARPLVRPLRRTALAPSAWLPPTDVYEKDGKVVVKAELPGMKKEDIAVTLEQGGLMITGERHAEREVQEDAYDRAQRLPHRVLCAPAGERELCHPGRYRSRAWQTAPQLPAPPGTKERRTAAALLRGICHTGVGPQHSCLRAGAGIGCHPRTALPAAATEEARQVSGGQMVTERRRHVAHPGP
jgi:hypothetical protein